MSSFFRIFGGGSRHARHRLHTATDCGFYGQECGAYPQNRVQSVAVGHGGVHIIDPFVGTGNFIVRLMRDKVSNRFFLCNRK